MKQPELGKKIVELRKAKNLTQEELVEKCNLNVRTLQRIESGEVTPRGYTIKIIFNALDYDLNNSSEIAQSESGSTGFTPIQRLEQVYRYLIDLFSLKTNTMKKLSILFFFIATFLFLAFTLKVQSQSNNSNPLIGKWKLVAIADGSFGLNDPAYQRKKIKIDNSATRFLEFKPDLSFETRTNENGVFNAGAYTMLNETSFITVHAGLNGELAAVSNLYRFKIASDTLHFVGFYLKGAPGMPENYYERHLIDEWWVKLKK